MILGVEADLPTYDPERGTVPFERPVVFELSTPPQRNVGAQFVDGEGNDTHEPGPPSD